MVELMISQGATEWEWGLESACEGGQREMAELMIDKGATNWNEGLEAAYEGDHYKLIELMVEKGATCSDDEGIFDDDSS